MRMSAHSFQQTHLLAICWVCAKASLSMFLKIALGQRVSLSLVRHSFEKQIRLQLQCVGQTGRGGGNWLVINQKKLADIKSDLSSDKAHVYGYSIWVFSLFNPTTTFVRVDEGRERQCITKQSTPADPAQIVPTRVYKTALQV